MLHIIELTQFGGKDRLLIKAALEDKQAVSIVPSLQYLRWAGIHPDTEKEGEIHIPGYSVSLKFKMSRMEDQWIMQLLPVDQSDTSDKIQKTLSRIREEEFPGYIKGIIMNVPEFFEDPEFMAWVNSDLMNFARHPKGQPAGEWSEVILTIDPGLGGDGSECSDERFPEWCWEVVINEARRRMMADTSGKYIYQVKLTNYRE